MSTLMREFLIQYHKSSPYHPQANGIVESFNKILEIGLAKVCCTNRDDWDKRVSVMLWTYQTTTKKLHRFAPFQLVYGREAVVPAEFITPNLFIVQATQMTDNDSITTWVA